MTPSFRSFDDDMRVHRLGVAENVISYCRKLMQSIRFHDIDWCKGDLGVLLRENYIKLKQYQTYGSAWECEVQENKDLANLLYPATKYYPKDRYDMRTMSFGHLIELCADIINWAEIQQVDPQSIVNDFCYRLELDSVFKGLMSNTVREMLQDRR